MDITLVDQSDTRIRRGDRSGKGVRYGRYKTAIKPLIPWIKQQISESKTGKITMKPVDIAEHLGSEFKLLKPKSLYWALKYVLFFEGIAVYTATMAGKRQVREALITIQFARDDYRLPPSLIKYIKNGDDITLLEKKNKATTPADN